MATQSSGLESSKPESVKFDANTLFNMALLSVKAEDKAEQQRADRQ